MTDGMQKQEPEKTPDGSSASQPSASAGNAGATQPKATDAGAAGQPDASGKDGAAGAEGRSGPPEKYEFKTPDGVSYDEHVLGAFSEVAKELRLSQDEAQKVLDRMTPVFLDRQKERLAAMRTEWSESSRADKEFGGDKLSENLATAKKALDAFGTPELKKLLNETGLGDHPEVIRVFYRAGRALSEDRFVAGQPGEARKSDPQRFYSASKLNP